MGHSTDGRAAKQTDGPRQTEEEDLIREPRKTMSPPSSTLFSLSPSSLVLTFLLVFVWSSQNLGGVAEARSVALPSSQCHPAVVNTMKPRIKQICKALEAIWEFSDVMENYLDEKESEEFLAARQQRPLVNSGVKRKGEDPDHVFLRFGKRSHY